MSFPTLGLQRGGDLGRAPVRGSANIASGRAHAPETAKGSRHGPTRVSGVRGSERRSDRRKAYLPYGPRLSVVSGRSPRTTVKCHVCYYFTFYHSPFFLFTQCVAPPCGWARWTKRPLNKTSPICLKNLARLNPST